MVDLNVPDIPAGHNTETQNYMRAVKEILENLLGKHAPEQKAMTYQNAIDIGLIDEDFEKI